MDTIIKGAVIYVFLLLIFRISGKRTMYDATVFDFVLLLIIAETTQQALLGDDFSLTNGLLLIMTLIILDIIISLLKQKFNPIEKLVDGSPLIIMDKGQLLRDRMRKERIDEADIMESARDLHGLQRLDQIKYAILEKNGKITIIPQEEAS
ncbi:DUF421 domain-containing protein [Pontibacter sp. BT310]|jgi:uncharacterized membrane protein YcaP (DUF421 family)|uniref:DUF421 domain-containing protein n=1 Tax=Pontibacter populi TaxID=890055 RepID=A0ABS6XBW5_9BACT|nr:MULTISPECIES: YetF domain-containing protein [Pontibacter]MBJ6118648.1 DUF421 domain-containing protein [Pontibacter sp. BT310]MBR0571077.1 DUF421 domain-containing protein [Microvirga sp. STS03]MBW3365502.1 DUF421 domain-containing protein [Pontibacter populi]